MNRISNSHRALAVAAAALVALGGCSNGTGNTAQAVATEPSDHTLAEAISSDGDLSTLAGALRDSGLSQIFDGAGSYTILAPTNEAFAKLGDAGKALTQQGDGAAMAAMLRGHIVPGYLTPTDIGSAIDAHGGQAKIESMGNGELKFTREGDAIKVTAGDGSSAMISGAAVEASNGVAIPLDSVLKNLALDG